MHHCVRANVVQQGIFGLKEVLCCSALNACAQHGSLTSLAQSPERKLLMNLQPSLEGGKQTMPLVLHYVKRDDAKVSCSVSAVA